MLNYDNENDFTSAQDVKVKRGRGRPPGPSLPPADLLHPHTVRLTDAEWEACCITGGASAFIRQAVQHVLKQQCKRLSPMKHGVKK